ncbi:TetR/AcrR family transcriptional regulator [Acidicapsa dinghuensis]|uniref:TetR/AcrR family transcriptional regulator n=1 Tax=Acidicapsa dinghuensis TaxID=2218256 RepID=A0ABW1E958_9BACT|nr:TetR/AcrR family transcriptional regulator [Acidicapsa dinghuensis]
MRYPAEHKAETHASIVAAASRIFRERGAEANGIGSVMKELGLTKGGFYRHFKSRDQLYAEAVIQAFVQMGDAMVAAAEAAPPGRQLQALIERYLSVEHLKSPGAGCVIATLGSDIARQSPALRKQIARSMQAYRERLLPYMPGSTMEEKTAAYAILYPSMVGVMVAARSVVDKAYQEQMLARAREHFVRAWSAPE